MSTGASAGYGRPLPQLDGFTAAFYGFLKQHELRFQRCEQCGTWRHVPRELCPECKSPDFEWARSAGRGRVHSWTVTHRSLHPAFADTPFAQVAIELDEGPRLLAGLVEGHTDELVTDRPARVVFRDVTPDVTLAFVELTAR